MLRSFYKTKLAHAGAPIDTGHELLCFPKWPGG